MDVEGKLSEECELNDKEIELPELRARVRAGMDRACGEQQYPSPYDGVPSPALLAGAQWPPRRLWSLPAAHRSLLAWHSLRRRRARISAIWSRTFSQTSLTFNSKFLTNFKMSISSSSAAMVMWKPLSLTQMRQVIVGFEEKLRDFMTFLGRIRTDWSRYFCLGLVYTCSSTPLYIHIKIISN